MVAGGSSYTISGFSDILIANAADLASDTIIGTGGQTLILSGGGAFTDTSFSNVSTIGWWPSPARPRVNFSTAGGTGITNYDLTGLTGNANINLSELAGVAMVHAGTGNETLMGNVVYDAGNSLNLSAGGSSLT